MTPEHGSNDHLYWELTPDRAALTIRGIGSAEVTAGTAPSVRLESGAEQGDEAVLLASAVPMALLLDRQWPLRASAVGFSGRAIVFTGAPAVGASTAAAAAVSRGARLLADGHTVIDSTVRSPSDPPIRNPSTTIDLWPDALRAIGWRDDLGNPIRRRLGKRRVDLADPASPTDDITGGCTIVALTIDPLVDDVTIETVRGFDAVRRLTAATWHGWAIDRLGWTSEHLTQVVSFAQAVPLLKLRVPRTTGRPVDTVRAVEVLLDHLDADRHVPA